MKRKKVGKTMKLKTIYQDKEFNRLIEPVIYNEEYRKTKQCVHHGCNRYDHMIRVSYYSYKITKFFHLNYKEATRASVLHDFFLDEKEEKKLKKLFTHPDEALENSKKYFELTKLEEDIIKTHMFPVGNRIPKYLESWIVDIIDDVASVYEKVYVMKNSVTLNFNVAIMMIFMLIRK